MFAQVNDAQAVERIVALILIHDDTVVNGDEMGAAAELVVGDRFEDGQAHAFLGRHGAGVNLQRHQNGMRFQFQIQLRIGGGDQYPAVGQMAGDLVPVEVGVAQEQNGVGGEFAPPAPPLP